MQKYVASAAVHNARVAPCCFHAEAHASCALLRMILTLKTLNPNLNPSD